MGECNHRLLELLPEKEDRVRCRHCHLTISRAELQGSYCPECFDRSGARHYDFDEVNEDKASASRYRCEQCGVIVTSS
jgi:hypothetical protein